MAKKGKGKGGSLLGLAGSLLGMIPGVGSASKAKKGKSSGKNKSSKGKNKQKSSKKKGSNKKKQRKSNKKKKKKRKKKWGKIFTKARKLFNNLSKSKMVKNFKKAVKKAVLQSKKTIKKAVPRSIDTLRKASVFLPMPIRTVFQLDTINKRLTNDDRKMLLSTALDFVPIVSNVKSVYELAYGEDPITKEKLATWEKWVTGASIVLGPISKGVKAIGKPIIKGSVAVVKKVFNKITSSNKKPQIDSKPNSQPKPKPDPDSKQKIELDLISKLDSKQKIKLDPIPKPKSDPKPKPMSDPKPKSDPKPMPMSDPKPKNPNKDPKKPDDTKGTGNGVPKHNYSANSKNHLIQPEGVNKTGVSGGHNEKEFFNYLDANGIPYKVEKKEPHPSVPGVYDVYYKIGKQERGVYTSEFKASTHKKTVYDENVFTDEQMYKYCQEAMDNGTEYLTRGGQQVIQGTSNGLKFEGWKNPTTGEIESVYPVLEWKNYGN